MSNCSQLTCDVLIVGGGPAGLSVASTLSKDISAIIVHQDNEIGKPVRTSGGSWLSDMERLGVPQHLYQKITSLDIFSDNERAHFSMNNDPPVVLDVTGLYKWIAEKSADQNTNILLGTKFISTEMNERGQYVSRIRSKRKDVETIVSNYIVDASGVRCSVLRSLSLMPKPARYGVGVEYEYPIGSNDPDRAILFVGRDTLQGYGWVFPTADHRLRIGIGIIHPDTNVSPRDLMERFMSSSALDRFGIQIEGEVLQRNAGTLPSIPYDSQLVFGNVIRVGDSANFATPTVGEGIRICMELGELLGRNLGKTIRLGSLRYLRQYEKECRRVLYANYKVGLEANKRISSYDADGWDRSVRRLCRLSEPEIAALIRSEFSPKLILKTVWKNLRQKLLNPS